MGFGKRVPMIKSKASQSLDDASRENIFKYIYIYMKMLFFQNRLQTMDAFKIYPC